MNKKRIGIIHSILFGILMAGIFIFTGGIRAEAKDGYFVETEDRVYFRKYGKEALEKTVLWGEYFKYPTGKKGSFVASYDKNSGQVKKEFDDDGGRLYYDNQRFYLEKRENRHDYKTDVYEIGKNGEDSRIVAEYANILELSDRGYLAITVTEPEEAPAIEVIKDGDKLFRTGATGENEILQYIGITGDYLLYGVLKSREFQKIRFDIYGMDLKGTSNVRRLGSLNLEDKYLDGIDIGTAVWKNGKAYFSVFYFDGTGHFISEGFVCRVDPKKKNSLKKMTGDISKTYSPTSDISVDKKGKIKMSEYKKNQVYMEEKSVYLFRLSNNKKLITKDIGKLFGSQRGGEYKVAAAELIDGDIYMIVNRQKRAESEDIGWREAYRILERYYVRLPLDGKSDEMQILYKDKF